MRFLFTKIPYSLPSLTSHKIFSILNVYTFKIQVQLQATESQIFQGQQRGKFEKLRKKWICDINSDIKQTKYDKQLREDRPLL